MTESVSIMQQFMPTTFWAACMSP